MAKIDINTDIINLIKKYLESFSKSIVARFYTKSDIDKKMGVIDSRSEVGSQLDYGLFTRSTDLYVNAVGSDVTFDKSNGSNMTLNANGRVILRAGKKYRIMYGARTGNLTTAIDLGIYDYTNSKQISQVSDNHSSNATTVFNPGVCYYTPTVDCEVAPYVTYYNSTTSVFFPYYACYMEVQEVGRTAVLDPVQQLDKDSGMQDTPVGHIISVMGSKAPVHYLVCDGSIYNILDYQKLANYFLTEFGKINYFGGDGVTTFAVPDMRGEFVRGYDKDAIRDPDGNTRGIGKHQDATQQPRIWNYGNGTTNSVVTEIQQKGVSSDFKNYDKAYKSNLRVFHDLGYSAYLTTANTESIYALTSRPTNVNVLFCIKFEPTYFMNYSPQYAGFDSKVLYDSFCSATGTYELKDSITKYDMLIFCTTNVGTPTSITNSNNHLVYCSDIAMNNNRELYGYNIRYLNYKFINDTTIYLNVISDMYLYKIIGIKSGTAIADFTITDAEVDSDITSIWNEVSI